MKILSEPETLAAAARMSLARYGDGELRVAVGGICYGHRFRSAQAVLELRDILQKPQTGLLVCIPRYGVGPYEANWEKYRTPQFVRLFNKSMTYGSAFVTRPDSAPWIDTPDYWRQVRSLWEGKDVTLVAGSVKSLTADLLAGAGHIRAIAAPANDAYREIDRIEDEIGKPSGPVLMCLGVTATILAARLAKKNVHALDLGHIGMFMRRYGRVDHVKLDQLISPAYLRANQQLHAAPEGFGGSGWKHAGAVSEFVKELKPKEVLDYGCGESTLRRDLSLKIPFYEYDPAVPGKSKMPRPAGLVVCTDVLEHIEPDKLDNVLAHIYNLTVKGAYVVVATRPANKTMPDGSNAHKIIESNQWWADKLGKLDWKIIRIEGKQGHDVRLWIIK